VGLLDLAVRSPYRPGMDRRRFLVVISSALAAPLAVEAGRH
jgi:hypothetical protein